MALPKSSLDWKFTQVFGDKSLIENVMEEDIITSMNFSRDGRYLAIGDIAGRIVVFEHKSAQKNGKKLNELSYKTEFQSHFKEFDCLKSVDIDPKINLIEFLPTENENNFLLSSNDKTIKLWKLSDRVVRKSERFPKKTLWTKQALSLPKIKVLESGLSPVNKVCYPMLHNYNINSISTCADGERFLSSDDLTINLWFYGETARCFTIFDIAPKNLSDISEVLTSARFDPNSDSLFACGTSKGILKLCDLRSNSRICAASMQFEDEKLKSTKNFFTDFVSSISDFTFAKDPNLLVSRSLLAANVWDRRAPKQPLVSTQLYEPIKSKLVALYEKELIFDKFDIRLSGDPSYFVTGMYNNAFHVCDLNGEKNTQFELNFKKKTISKLIKPGQFEQIGPDFDITKRVLKTACHPNFDFLVVASFNCLFVYNSL